MSESENIKNIQNSSNNPNENNTEQLYITSAPHITKKGNSTRRVMIDVLIALCPSAIAAIYYFGYMVAINIVLCCVSCFGFELLYNCIKEKKFDKETVQSASVWDLSCLVTGVILALNLPTSFVIWEKVPILGMIIADILGSLVAIIIVKMLFGGIGRNFANPAAVGRIFLFLCFASAFKAVAADGIGLEPTTGATWLSQGIADRPVNAKQLLDMFLGNVGSASVGETCVPAILLGYIYLCIRKVIDWKLPLYIVGSVAVFSLLFEGLIVSHLPAKELFMNMLANILSGGLLFGAVFMATDYATSPNTAIGLVIYGIAIGFITVLIIVFASYPEGMSFAIVIMNIITPLIDKYIYPKPFGFVKEKKNKNKPETKEAAK